MKVFSVAKQVAFHQLLAGARKTVLADALSAAMRAADQEKVKAELSDLIPRDVQKALAATGIRDEWVFPSPTVLREQPTLVGYYRLLLGISQKEFYRGETGMGPLKSMEVSANLSDRQDKLLPEFCRAMASALSDLVRQLSPVMTPRDVSELPLLSLGAQFQGGNNVTIGKRATAEVFLAIAELVEPHLASRTESKLHLRNAAGREVTIRLGADPDVSIDEAVGSVVHSHVAVEIKGGTDTSNVHNRAGEAEKSHQKAREAGYRDFWTIILLKNVDVAKLHSESPTTTSWFDAAEVLGRSGPSWDDFCERLASAVGIPLTDRA